MKRFLNYAITLLMVMMLVPIFTNAQTIKRNQKPKTEQRKSNSPKQKKLKNKPKEHTTQSKLPATDTNPVAHSQNGEEVVYRSVDYMPHFPGGDSALMKYIRNNTNYPAGAIQRGVEGRVIVQFVVTDTGEVGEIKVARSIDEDLDQEAVRVCKSLPRFEPGRLGNGNPVNVWYSIPVTFNLPKHERPHDD